MTLGTGPTRRFSTPAKRFGYSVAVGIHVLLLVAVNNLLGWGWFPWLTPEFDDLLPIINQALAFSIAVYLLYMVYDKPWFKAITQIVVNVIAIAVLIRTWQVYPFDFSAHDFPVDGLAVDLSWDWLIRFVLGLAIFGTVIAIVTETVRPFRKKEPT